MRNLVVLFIHFIATLARLLGPGGVRSLVAESLLLKHQLLILKRSRKRSPNLPSSDRILAGLLALLVRPTRLLRSAIVLKPSTLLALHKSILIIWHGGLNFLFLNLADFKGVRAGGHFR
jgi:putative transposase